MDSFIAHLAWQDQASTRVKGLYHTCQYHVHVDDLACALHDHYSWYSTTHRICSRIWGTHAQGIPSQLMLRRRFMKSRRTDQVLGKPTLYGLYHWLPYRVGYHAVEVPSGLYGSHHQVIECLDRIELRIDVIKPLLACSPIASLVVHVAYSY